MVVHEFWKRFRADKTGALEMQEHHHEHGSDNEKPMTPEEAVRSLLVLGQTALNAEDYESAVDAYASALKIMPDEIASYNLGSLYARGLGVGLDFAEGARLFHQAELLGNEKAGKLCGKCMFDYVLTGFADKSPADLYAEMAVFVAKVYPEATNQKAEVANGLFAIAGTLFNGGAYAEAAKVLRASAEFGDDGNAQYHLGMLHNLGTGLQKHDLSALYWLDRAVDNGAGEEATRDRDGIIDAYRRCLTPEEFSELMSRLADDCEKGTSDVPVDLEKAARWRALA